MSRALITESYLTGIANAIRTKLSVQDTYTPPQMAAAIESIPTGGITPTGTKQITQNGTHDVTQYASANVNVQPNLQSKTVTENGTVTPDQGYDGLSSVVVNVSGGGDSDPALPAEYQEVEYLSVTGNQYVNVNFALQNRDIVRCWSALSSNAPSSELGFAGDAGRWDLYYENNQIIAWQVTTDILGVRNIERDTKNESYVMLSSNVSSAFQYGRYSSNAFAGKLYKFYAFRATSDTPANKGMKTICILIPCYRLSDSEPGFYDVINGVFYTNAGSGSFVKGPDVI